MRAGGGRVGQERRPLFDGCAEHLAAFRIRRQVVPGVLDPERHVPRFVHAGAAHDVRGHRVRRVSLDERQVLEERALAQDGQQERCLREVLLLEERTQRRLRLRRRVLQTSAVGQRPLRERLDVARLVDDLRGQEHHDLGEPRVDPRDELRRDVERRVLVLGEVGHDLAHRTLHVDGQLRQVRPRDVARGVPLGPGRLLVERRDVVRPHAVELVHREREPRRRPPPPPRRAGRTRSRDPRRRGSAPPCP